jgi:hypothetical protein
VAQVSLMKRIKANIIIAAKKNMVGIVIYISTVVVVIEMKDHLRGDC